MTLEKLAIDHDYYGSDSNYYNSSIALEYNFWHEFYNDYEDLDIDMNLIYRWDVHKPSEGRNGYSMELFVIQQRKGIYVPINILLIEEKDVSQIVSFLGKHFDKINSIWKPLSN